MNNKLLKQELETIRRDKIVSIFWITATNARAKRIMYLEASGEITRRRDHPADQYPWCVFDVQPYNIRTGFRTLDGLSIRSWADERKLYETKTNFASR